MKYISTFSILFSLILFSCEGNLSISSQHSTKSETSISENTQIIKNGDTTMRTHNRKEKSHTESENSTKIGFETKDQTGIIDEIKKRINKELGDDDTNDTTKTKEKSTANVKKTKKKIALKASVDCKESISADDFENAKAKIQTSNMDMDKVKKGKSLFNEICVTSKQAQELVSTLMMDNYKLDFAKFLYGRTTDKDKFMRVANEFSFDDNKRKLESYITD